MNAPERLPIVRAAIEGAVIIPLNLIEPSSTNPRHRPNDMAALQKAWNLNEMAESIKTHDVIQPIVVRPKAGVLELDGGVYVPVADKAGQPQYEIIAGERRWRASQLAGKANIIALVRPMSDFEVLELQVIENLQREDLHPIEEGESYRKLMRQPGGSQGYANADELAARLGKSRRYVYNRLSLCNLVNEARTACFDGHITASTALLIARLPTHHQAEATKIVVQGFGGEPLSFRSAQVTLERRFMLQLDKAPFKVADADLVPDAGSCQECPKRTGANPDLFDDIKSADTCTDHKCFQAKVDAHNKALLQAGEEKGLEVITGAAAKKVMPNAHSVPKGYLVLNGVHHDLGDKPVGELLGKDCPPIALLENPHTHEVMEVVREEQARAVLKKKDARKKPTVASPRELPPMTPKELAQRRAGLAGDFFGQLAFRKLHQVIIDDAQLPIAAIRLIVEQLARDIYYEALRLIYKAHEWPAESADEEDFARRIKRMTPRELAEIAIELLFCDDCSNGDSVDELRDNNMKSPLLELAHEYGVDLDELQKQADAEAAKQAKAEQARRVAAAAPKGKKPARAEPASTPTSSAAAQGAKSGPQTPEEALAAAVANEQAVANPPGKKSQKHKTAKLPASNQCNAEPKSPTKGGSQTDEPAAPAGGDVEAAKPADGGVHLSREAAWPFPIGSSKP
jgi:ParB/RepB/Spo0J family partition protein